MSLTPKPSKRDRLRSLLGRSRSPLPSRAGATLSRTSSPNPTYTRHASSILADALEALAHNERDTIRELLPSTAIGVDTVFDEVHSCATELERRSTMKRWGWTYKGRQVYLCDQMDKTLQFLDKFKSLGDAIANVDPVHVGLPWAGIRTILEVSIRPQSVPFRLCTDDRPTRSPCLIVINELPWSLG